MIFELLNIGRRGEGIEMAECRERCDMFVIDEHGADLDHRAIALKLLAYDVDWVEVYGVRSEQLHDMIDQVAVEIGLQKHAGDGKPMTAWHDEPDAVTNEIDSIVTGGFGSHDRKLVFVLGEPGTSSPFAACFIRAMRNEIEPDAG